MNKTISFAAIHFSVAFSIAYIMTGSVLVGGAMALVEPAVNTVAFHIHEKVWNRLKHSPAENQQGTMVPCCTQAA